MRWICITRRLRLCLIYFAGVAVICALPLTGAARQRLLNYDQLLQLGLLDNEEKAGKSDTPEGTVALGIVADLDGDGADETLIAGITCRHHGFTSDYNNACGYIKILRQSASSSYEEIWSKHSLEGNLLEKLIVQERVASIDRPVVLVSFTTWGSTYYPTFNVFVHFEAGKRVAADTKSGIGVPDFADLDKRGDKDVIIHQCVNPDAPGPTRVLWSDIYEIGPSGMMEVSYKYPTYYKKAIEQYESNIMMARAKLAEDPDSTVWKAFARVNESLIARAKNLDNRK